jgi:hypothetical protein
MDLRHLADIAWGLPEKMAEDCLFRQQNRVTSTRYPGKFGTTGKGRNL